MMADDAPARRDVAAATLFDRPGEMRARCRELDWGATPLGPVAAWPSSLRTAVDICLSSPVACYVWWGPQLIQIYNDAALAIVRAKHPNALGRPAREVWADAWPIVGALLERVTTMGEAARGDDLPVEPEQGDPRAARKTAWFTFSYSPVRDDRGNVGGVFCTALETTDRVRAEAALRTSEARYRALASASADVIYRMSADWSEMRQLDGRGFLSDTAEPSETWLERYIHSDDRSQMTAVIDEAVRTKRMFALEHRVVRADGSLAWALSRAVPMLDDDGRIVEWIGAATDITARHEADAALRELQLRLEEALTTARMAYWDWDPTTDVTVASASMTDLLGLRPGEHFGSSAQGFALVHPDDRPRHRALVEAAGVRGDGWHAEFRIVRPRNGEVAWLEERATVTRDPVTGATHVTGLVWDVTDRKRAEAAAELERTTRERDALRRLLADAEEAERRRLARELHDQLGQHLTAFELGLHEARRLLAVGRSADTHLAQLQELARLMTRDARHLALQLRPPELDDVGLESALQSYVEQWAERYGIATEVEVTGLAAERSIAPEVASTLYRIAQEALTNVARHARATQVSVLVAKDDGEVQLIVEDDGCGFDVEAMRAQARRDRRLGLAGVQERAALVGGTVTIESSPGHGTTIYVRLPMERPAPAEPTIPTSADAGSAPSDGTES